MPSVLEMPIEFETVRATRTHIRSVSALLSAVSNALKQSGYGQLRRLELQCDGDSISLAGQVPTYFLKQFAQSTVMSVPGVNGVTNEIRVVSR
jgi:osmotically-inducible protein OsmY